MTQCHDCVIVPWHMAATFAEKFEQALQERRQEDPNYGLRTIARKLADNDPHQTEIIRRRLNKYRPKPSNGGAAKVAPTEPTRREIEDAMGLDQDALKPEPVEAASAEFLRDIMPLQRLWEIAGMLERGELVKAQV